ncbi:MAG: hypothetical protein N3B13_06715, partial [Deltaproteobacteria bacterium]|nr:hypothetical protein [Deltaproteobacteria bacterium]
MKKLFAFLSSIVIICSCETRNFGIFPDTDQSTETNVNEEASEFRVGSFLIGFFGENSFTIRNHHLSLKGFSDNTGQSEFRSFIAMRSIDIGYEMMYGAFKPKDRIKTKWVIPDSISMNKISDNELRIDILISGETAGNISVTGRRSTEGEYLEIRFSESEKYNRISLSFMCENEAFIGFGAQAIDVNHYGNELFGWVQEQGIGKVMHDN